MRKRLNDAARSASSERAKIMKVWREMMYRCYNPKHPKYRLYGARGIKVCKRWHNGEYFLADMGVRPKGAILDRIDNDGPYKPSNHMQWPVWSSA